MSNAAAQEVQPLRRLILGYRLSQALGVAARLGIADLLKDGPLAVEQLASMTGVQADPLARVLRLLTGVGVFREVDPSRFALTPAAQPLRSDTVPSLRARAMFNISAAHWAAWGKLFEAVQTGEPAFERAHGTEVFAYLRSHPDEGALFDAVMAEGTTYAGEAVTRAYGLDEGAVVVDVGGGAGALLLAFLAANRTAQESCTISPRSSMRHAPGSRSSVSKHAAASSRATSSPGRSPRAARTIS